MNHAAELISNSITGDDFSTIVLGGKAYTIYPPTIKVICRAVKHFAKVSLNDEHTTYSCVGEIPINAPHILKGLSVLITGDVPLCKIRSLVVFKRIKATPAELKEALKIAIENIGGEDFFACATSAIEVAKIVANTKQ